jgi:hypothetical protein
MNHRNDEGWLDETIARAADIGTVEFDRTKWLDRLAGELQKPDAPSPRTHDVKSEPHKAIWRTIMESKVTRYSAAAVVALAVTLVLLSPFGTSKNGGVALANVQQKVDGIETMTIRGTKTFTRPGQPDSVFEFDGIKCRFDLVRYMSRQYGLAEEGCVEGRLIYRATFNRAKQQTLIVLPPWKKYVAFAWTDDVVKIMEDLTPRGIFNLLRESDYKDLGRDTIDGVEVQRFAFQSADPVKEILPKAVFDIQQAKGEVWIATKELLPIRIEGDVVIGGSLMTLFNDLNLHEVNTLGQFDVELDENIFDTEPPEGYTELTLTDILPLVPLEAKAGLVGLGIIPVGLVFWMRRRRARIHPS